MEHDILRSLYFQANQGVAAGQAADCLMRPGHCLERRKEKVHHIESDVDTLFGKETLSDERSERVKVKKEVSAVKPGDCLS